MVKTSTVADFVRHYVIIIILLDIGENFNCVSIRYIMDLASVLITTLCCVPRISFNSASDSRYKTHIIIAPKSVEHAYLKLYRDGNYM